MYLSVGSNIRPELHIPEALRTLGESVRVLKISDHFRTRPLGGEPGDRDFLNGIWMVETPLSPELLKDLLQTLELRSGRIPGQRNNRPRSLDLDILFFDAQVLPGIGIPDTDVIERPFLHIPLLELSPELIWPLTGQPLRDMVLYGPGDCPDGMVRDEEITSLLKGVLHGQG